MNKRVLAVLLITFIAPSLWALSFDANVIAGGYGVFYGTGNGNGGFTVDTENGIELGIRTHLRYPSPQNIFDSAGNGVYNWTDKLGYTGNLAHWNYDFSISLPNAVSNYSIKMFVDSDPTINQTWYTFDPTLIPDNTLRNNGQIMQNSENPKFSLVGIPGYSNTAVGTYDFALQAIDKATGAVLAETYMRVNVNGGASGGSTPFDGSVPDSGSSLLLLGLAIPMLAFLQRRRVS